MEVSIFKFNDNLPSSFLAATFGHRLFTPKDCLQRKICVFAIKSFSQVLKSSLSWVPHTSDPYRRIGKKRELKSLLVISSGTLEKSK